MGISKKKRNDSKHVNVGWEGHYKEPSLGKWLTALLLMGRGKRKGCSLRHMIQPIDVDELPLKKNRVCSS